MMSRALDDRFPLTESGLEYTPWNTFRNEDWAEDDKGELGAVIRRQARRVTPYTRPPRDTPVTARRAKSPLTDVTDSENSDTDGSDVEESTTSSHKTSKLKGEAGKSNSGWKDEEYATSDSEERDNQKIEAGLKGAPKPEDDELSSLQNLKMMSPAVDDRFPP